MPRPSWRAAACAAALGLLSGAAPVHAAGQERPDWEGPLAGSPRVVRAFDPPAQRWAAGHRGVDLLAREGVVVGAAGAGSVTFAGALAGRGVVVVSHGDGTRTTYEPVVATVQRGDRVDVGQALGRLSAAGGHCLPLACLHWGRRRGDVYLDPMLLLRPGPARLLPVWAAARDGPQPDAALRRPTPSGRSAQHAGRGPAASSAPWRLTSAAAAGPPVIAAVLVTLALWRRRAQSRAGSSAASSA